MSVSFFFFFYLTLLGSGFSGFNTNVNGRSSQLRSLANAADAPCPLNFTVLRKFIQRASLFELVNSPNLCGYVLQGLRLVLSDYLKRTNYFYPPLNASQSCWNSYNSLLREFRPNLNVQTVCGFKTRWISEGCMNITSRSEFEARVPESTLGDLRRSCNHSLENNSPCATCSTSLSRLQASYLPGPDVGNVTECGAYPFIYVAGLVNLFGPTDDGTAKCLFSLGLSSSGSSRKKMRKGVICGLVIGSGLGFLLAILGFWFVLRRRKNRWRRMRKRKMRQNEMNSVSALESMGASTTLVRLTFEQIKEATNNFSRDFIIGRGRYGIVYRGILGDGTEVALKRFKNCSALGDENFAHEVEVIVSVRHVNLVALRGYCIATTAFEGHQRIIVCDLMKNGSLHDHLFGLVDKKLSWPIRQKIAIGTARGLAYLHYGAQPAIIHRDIKASNILLDGKFEAKVADFGLAKFAPEGMSHMSTRVAGTLGYVAPEYALYGRLTERSDVYSFGVVLLELLSGRKALVTINENQSSLVTDWAWSLVKDGKTLDVLEDGMPELGPLEVMEKYVLVAVLCSHPQLYARPTMDQIVKILETDLPVPSIPDRPIPIVANISDIKQSMSSSGSGLLSSSAGYQAFTSDGGDHPSSDQGKENSL